MRSDNALWRVIKVVNCAFLMRYEMLLYGADYCHGFCQGQNQKNKTQKQTPVTSARDIICSVSLNYLGSLTGQLRYHNYQ